MWKIILWVAPRKTVKFPLIKTNLKESFRFVMNVFFIKILIELPLAQHQIYRIDYCKEIQLSFGVLLVLEKLSVNNCIYLDLILCGWLCHRHWHRKLRSHSDGSMICVNDKKSKNSKWIVRIVLSTVLWKTKQLTKRLIAVH